MVNGFGSFDPPGSIGAGLLGRRWPTPYSAARFRKSGCGTSSCTWSDQRGTEGTNPGRRAPRGSAARSRLRHGEGLRYRPGARGRGAVTSGASLVLPLIFALSGADGRRHRAAATAVRARAQKEKAPTAEPSRLEKRKNPGNVLLSHQVCPGSTIGAGGLNGRVRNGNGCDPSAMVTGKLDYKVSPEHSKIAGRKSRRSRMSVVAHVFKHYKHYGQASRPISTGKLHALLRLHIRPINLVVYQGSLGAYAYGRPHLEAGFTLRCFQRLSLPNIATQLCPWRDNWCTRGSSIPVLSY